MKLDELEERRQGFNVMQMKVRAEMLMYLVHHQLPWEDMSIGFQIRVSRSPNQYESDFWYYFTNEYIRVKHYRYSDQCGVCSLINQNPTWVQYLES